MPPKIFATGVTGYVGGDVLHALLQTHPSWEPHITCLVRSESRAASLSAAYPKLRLVYGTLEDSSILEEEASKAEIVLHWASSDHVGAAQAIKKGLEKGRGGVWIHTSGTDVLLNPKIFRGEKEKPEDVREVKVYDDWENERELIAFPETHFHRPCDMVPLSISSPKIKTAIVCPPTIWGKGRGTGSTRSHQIYGIAQLILEKGQRVLIYPASTPKTFWPNIHVKDLARLYIDLIDAAATELKGEKSAATWGQEGYYFAENGVHYWQDVANLLAEEAQKQRYLEDGSVEAAVVDDEGVRRYAGPAVWNLGSSCKSVRANKLFGWKPREKELKDEIAEIVRSEAERAGILKRA